MTPPGQHLSLTLLSDATHRVAALHLAPVGVVSPDHLQGLALAELAALIPCIVCARGEGSFSPEQQALLAGAGCRITEPALIGRQDGVDPPPEPPTAKYLRGGWYLQPLAKPLPRQTASRTLALKLAKLVATDADNFEIEDIFRREPTLSYNLLRLVNSPGMGTGRRIDSLAQAIMILGRRQLRRWLNLLLFSSQRDDPRSPLLLAHVTVRARLMEQLAHEAGLDKEAQEHAFMTGMFSLLGVMFGTTLSELLQPLNLEPAMTAALLHREGELGQRLALVEALERGDAGAAQPLLCQLMPAPLALDVDALLIDAHAWMLGLLHTQGENSHG